MSKAQTARDVFAGAIVEAIAKLVASDLSPSIKLAGIKALVGASDEMESGTD